jgi:hypothetical protein
MRRLYVLFSVIGLFVVCVSFSTDPPNGKTGAPGDSFCGECHVQPGASLGGTLTLEGFPDAIVPNQTYTLTVVNRDTVGNAVRGGFQMTILGPTNTRAGTMASPSGSAALQNLSGRQYFEHHPAVSYPDSNVVRWTVQWTAPDLPDGSTVSYYLAGTICNGNFQNTGDRVKTTTGSGTVMISADETVSTAKPELFPNPGTEVLYVKTSDDLEPNGSVYFYNATGAFSAKTEMISGECRVPDIAPGLYWLKIQVGEAIFTDRWIKL